MLSRFRVVLALLFLIANAYAQTGGQCPQNIGFENGTFANWKCYSGMISETLRGVNPPQPPIITLYETGLMSGQHTLIRKGDEIDQYGEFSLNSPNGSEYVIRLGNNVGGRGAERVSYTLEVPSNVDTYSVIFNYAVVLQNPNHLPDEQPKFTVQIFDESTESSTSCGSFEFVAGGSLPGFEVSNVTSSVLFKRWSPALLNLTEYLGHRIRLEFTTNDCTFNAHFGYVYLDFTENCSHPVTGNVICPGVRPVTLKALPGFDEYEWSDAITGEVLGRADSLVLPATTPVGKKIAVKLVPYPGLGCIQTLYTTIEGPKLSINQPPRGCGSVDISAPSVTAGNYPEFTYSYWLDEAATIPIANPKNIIKSGTYYIKGTVPGGCFEVAAVTVLVSEIPVVAVSDPEPVRYPETVDITKSFIHHTGVSYSYWKDASAQNALSNPEAVNRDGKAYIKATNSAGCFTITPVTVDIIYASLVISNTFSPNGDGVNDVLTVAIDENLIVKNFKIFNQWGQIVFMTSDIYNYWDGSKGGSMLPQGVYYWLCEGVDDSERKFTKAGSVTLLR